MQTSKVAALTRKLAVYRKMARDGYYNNNALPRQYCTFLTEVVIPGIRKELKELEDGD